MGTLRLTLRLLRGRSGASAVANVALGNALILGLNVLTGVITARLLGPSGRGELAALLLWPQFLGYAFAFALPSAVVFHARNAPSTKADLAGQALLLSAVGGLLAAVVGVTAMPLLLRQAGATALLHARWMMLFAPTATVATTLTALIQNEERFHFYNFLRYAPIVLTAGCLLALGAAGRLTPLSGALAYFLPGVPIFAWMAWWVWRIQRPKLRWNALHARPLLHYGARAYGGEAAGTLLGQLDKLVLVNLLGSSAFGVYVVIFNLSRMLTTLSSSLAPVLFPKTAGREPCEVMRITEKALSVTTPLLVIGAAGFMLMGGLLLRVLYGPQFAGAHLALCLLSAEAVLFSLAHVLTQPFLALNRPGMVTLLQIASVPALALSLWFFAVPFGVSGAAAALLCVTSLRLLFTYLALRVFHGTRPPRIVPSVSASLQRLREWREAA